MVTSPRTPASNAAVLRAAARTAGGRLVILPEARAGFPAAVNTGLARATGTRVGLLLSDDWLDAGAVEQCAALDADIVSSGVRVFAADGVTPLPHLGRTPQRAAYDALPTLEAKAVTLTHFLLLDRGAVLAAGGLDESLGNAPGIDDFDLLWTLLERGARVALTGRPLYNYRVHDGERLTYRHRDEQLRTLGRILDKHGVTGAARVGVIERHAPWFGRAETDVDADLRARAGGPSSA